MQANMHQRKRSGTEFLRGPSAIVGDTLADGRAQEILRSERLNLRIGAHQGAYPRILNLPALLKFFGNKNDVVILLDD